MSQKLQRGYRRLLLGYPRAYRRERGDELIATLMESAPAGRSRPTAREAANLLRHGLRARLGRPASRSVVAWAMLAAVISGVFGAAFACRAGWEAARPLPGPEQTRAMLAEIMPGEQFNGIEPAPALFVIYGQPLGWATAGDLLLGDGAEYAQAGVGGSIEGGPDVPAQQTVDRAVERLRATGWTIYPPVIRDQYECGGPPCDPATIPTSTTILARRGDTVFTLEVRPHSPTDTTFVSAVFTRATPAAVYPAAIAGGLLAAIVAFLAFGWVSRRTAGRHLASGVVKPLFGVTMLLWCVPTPIMVLEAIEHHLDEPHPSWHPMWEWLGEPALSLLFLIGAGCSLLCLALAALPQRHPAGSRPDAVPSVV